MYDSQFDGNAAFSGGGFMPPQSTQSTVDHFSSSSKSRDSQGLFPLTVKQINEALISNNDNFGIDGVDVSNVTLVGRVCEKSEKATEVSFFLDDGTGRINVSKWTTGEPYSNEMANITNGIYVRVHASLKGFQDKRHLVAFNVRPLTDFNELTFHFLECMYVHMYNTKLRTASVSAEPQMTTSVNGTPFRGHQGTLQSQFAELKGVDEVVMNFMQQPRYLNSEKGVDINELAQRLNLPLNKIKDSIKVLEDEGFVYSTIDDQHYKSTANA